MANVQNMDLNTASAEEIATAGIPNVNRERAEVLVEYRDENGPFESWEDIKEVPGFSDEMVSNLQEAGARLGAMEESEMEQPE